MNKTELIEAVAAKAGMTKVETAKAVGAAIEVVKEAIAAGEKVTLVGFGTFEAVERPARTGRNPHTGEPIQIAAKKVAKFKAGKGLI